MPDVWEAMQELDPLDPEDRNSDTDGNGYTELEEYLHALANGVRSQLVEAANNASVQTGPAVPAVNQPLIDVAFNDGWYPGRPTISITGPSAPAAPVDASDLPQDGLRSIRRTSQRLQSQTLVNDEPSAHLQEILNAHSEQDAEPNRTDLDRSVNSIARKANRLRRAAAHFDSLRSK